MVVVDLRDLEERAQLAAASIGGVVLESEAVLLIVSEIRRMKLMIGEQHGHLADMRSELLKLRAALAGGLREPDRKKSALPLPAGKHGNTLAIKAVQK